MFLGDPTNGKQCYRRIDTKLTEAISFSRLDELRFFAARPSFTNVNIRISIDVLQGDVEIFITDQDDVFKVQLNSTYQQLRIEESLAGKTGNRKRRSFGNFLGTEFMPSRSASNDRITTFVNYDSGVLWMYNVRSRLVITIDHTQHDLSNKKFYFVVRPANKTGNALVTRALVYFRQDLPRIDLLLFFLVLSVILLFILSAFIIGMKIRIEFLRNAQNQIQQIELNAMKSRPLGEYPLLFQQDEEDIVKKRKNRLHSPRSRNKVKPGLDFVIPKFVLPLAVQETEDKLAAVVSTVIQLPKNETSEYNLAIGSGICQIQNQQLLQIRTSTNNSGGKKLQTRYHATQINS